MAWPSFTDERLPKIMLFGYPSGAEQKADGPLNKVRRAHNKDLRVIGTSWKGLKEDFE